MNAQVIPFPQQRRKSRRPNDLPPLWDGVPVTWGEWNTAESTLAFHVSAEALACQACGAVGEKATNFGMRPPENPTTTVHVEKRTRNGHRYTVPTEVPAWPVRDLVAARCRHCGQDTVTDEHTGETWDLEPEDYMQEGSTPTDVLF